MLTHKIDLVFYTLQSWHIATWGKYLKIQNLGELKIENLEPNIFCLYDSVGILLFSCFPKPDEVLGM